MKNKALQEQRIRGYFIEATKEILKSEGLKSVSVRNIAEKAGYSFATLYNYFKDAKDLVFLCVQDFQEECSAHVVTRSAKAARGGKKLRAILLAYLEYFVQYPGIFELFFMEKLSELNKQPETASMITGFPDRLCEEEWKYLIANKTVSAAAAANKRAALLYGLSGLLLLYINRQMPAGYPAFLKAANTFIDSQLKEMNT
ncbi:DNA-binding transcriptional regulator, AcrR family [Chitinophaga eiseniae]|uniref:DNA-binding transcriptional regulator, AcrR family n=1 Tax=Chitinophaga eiseniae TaxID=634771 RepID=A0A1T4TZP7_9BACT|nr:TetR/AcrR family transcriptional regulator [Chitinophaga eiseniae]SKA45718.1 DNA-binding transcriptional regulator, AcrR family [Chitinophaga eiseniae]